MRQLIIIGSGGFLGAVLRYLVSGWVQQGSRSSILPWGTLSVNLIGCLIIGILGGLVENREMFRPETRLFLMIGVLGSFTTFSTFSYETLALLRDNQILTAAANVTVHIVAGILAAWLGFAVTQG